ncbi:MULTISPECIES: hypothetical protein [unclassified Streptomyces]|uniref:hypothetical protein n=1 Tax=unclassified Streptomyces TaxID=2593676 RepID=UPI0033273BDA
MSAVVFLDINGTEMAEVDQDEAYKRVIEVARGGLADVDRTAGRLRALHGAM